MERLEFSYPQKSKHVTLLIILMIGSLGHSALAIEKLHLDDFRILTGTYELVTAIVIFLLSLYLLSSLKNPRLTFKARIILLIIIQTLELQFILKEMGPIMNMNLNHLSFDSRAMRMVIGMIIALIDVICAAKLFDDYIKILAKSFDQARLLHQQPQVDGQNLPTQSILKKKVKFSAQIKKKHIILLLIMIGLSSLHIVLSLGKFKLLFDKGQDVYSILWMLFAAYILILSICLLVNVKTNNIIFLKKLILIWLILVFQFGLGVDIASSAILNFERLYRYDEKYSDVDSYYSLELADAIITFFINLPCIAILMMTHLSHLAKSQPFDVRSSNLSEEQNINLSQYHNQQHNQDQQ